MSLTNSLLGTLMSLPTLNYNFMDTLDKYRIIIDRIQEMCTSTVALAPYPMGPVSSITTVHYKSNKGAKERKMPKPTKAIVETMLELAELCEGYYLYGQPVSGDTFRAFMEKKKQGAEALKKQLEEESKSPLAKAKDKILHVYTKIKAKVPYNKEKSKAVIGQAIDTMKKPQEQLNCSYVSEGGNIYTKPEYTIPRGNVKRVQNNMNRYTNRALDRNPDAKYMQKQAVAAFVKMMKAKVGSGRKKLSPEELEAVKNIYKFAPANMDPQERKKYQRAIEQKKKYKEYMKKAKEKQNI